ncbi:MAG TPA: glycoside hydrolase family 2 TIM barrel-domain containing protein [Terriglobia bacterium]|nr:glycoside hydrolase family 2 TIM barrel-domain containing protein [Terriglobia bacterium]
MRKFLHRTITAIILLACFGFTPALAATAKDILLDGVWSFVPDPSATITIGTLPSGPAVRPVNVPGSWQSEFTDLRDYAGVAWYWRTVTLAPTPAGQVALLRFGAVDYLAEVYLNGQKVGTHEGGYLPFAFDVTSLLRAGENQIAVRVVDPGAKPNEVVEGIKYAEIPHGKQNWYVQTSGLWQSVALDYRPQTYLGPVHITAGADGQFKIHVPLVSASSERTASPPEVDAAILDSAGTQVWQGSRAPDAKTGASEFSGKLVSPNLWSLSNPALYTLQIKTSLGETQSYRFGFRTFETRAGKFYLNGRVIYLRGALDQDFYPDTVYTPPSLDYLRDEMRHAKALGLNLLRCHIKVPDPRYLQAADEAGVLIWYEIPNWDKLTPDSERRALETLHGMVERDWNHPCIVIVSIINESWGANLKEAPQRAWLEKTYQQAKTFVPGWLVDDNSACCDNFHLQTDLADFHQYVAIPDYPANFDRLIFDQAARPSSLFSPYGDARPRGDEPLVLSEFGNWGLPRLHLPLPWWFTRDFGGRPITLPEGVEKRFKDYQYGSLFPDFNALADATQWHEFESLKYEIGSLRMHPEMQGYVITEFTDINWESNGLLDMWRHPKVFGGALAKIQQNDLVVARADRRNFTSGERARAQIYFSHYGGANLAGATVTWEIEGTPLNSTFALPPVPVGSAARVGIAEFVVPSVNKPVEALLKVRVTSGARIISEDPTAIAFYFFPPRPADIEPAVAFHDPGGRLRRLVTEMRARGYQQPSGAETFPVLIASVFDDEVKKNLRAGGRVILIAGEKQTLAPGLEVLPRTADNLDGNWISSFLWVRKDRDPFKPIGFSTLAGFETISVTPGAVLKGVPPQNFDDVLSGIFYGWIHSSVVALVQARCGAGKLLVCTFSLSASYGSDPYATTFLDALVNYAVSNFSPRYQIPL